MERFVRIGFAGDGRVDILEGLTESDRVIVSGAATLSDGTPVKVVQAARSGVPR